MRASRISGHVSTNLASKVTAHGRNASAAVATDASATQLGPAQVATLLGEILATTEISVTAILSTANINRGGEAAMVAAATNAIGPDVGKTATASLPVIRFETIGVANGTRM